ncbi:EAL domain-containing protein [Anaerotignum sp.]|uniref:EAL domain-containing protein n=1 Tax=Anaerotignum sp. TaxID=2039241 RepID=UPI002714F15F|nr:EAL domain-containing protein [Anaerotignum sp.]
MPLKKNVLVVDDHKLDRQKLSDILCHQYKILEAENGEEALKILHDSYTSISVILLDIAMPIMDGYQVLAEISRDVFLHKIPVILISQNEKMKGSGKTLCIGVQDIIQKPYLPDEIMQQVAKAIYYSELAMPRDFIQQDKLTGLYSREYFYQLVSDTLQKNPDKKYDIICSDIERFKLVNELFGTEEGDDLLKFVAQMIQDKINGAGICGRIGGDIFAAMVEHSEEYAEQDFIESAEYINQFNANLHSVIKFGIYAIEDRNLPVNIMCARACFAIESIKGKYGAHCAYYDDSIRQKLLDEQFILSNMKSALINKEFVVFFQPKYDLRNEKICSAEALVRWNHPERGLIPPGRFIQIFENTGFITELDLYVLEETCKWVRSWIDRGNALIPVSVNISRADIFNSDIDTILLSLLNKYHLSPCHIHLEITESAYTENAEQMINGIKQLKELGFLIEMDDFGSGYSSLNMLSELPIDVLKLDMRFVQNHDRSRDKKNIMSFVISLAKWMNLMVVAEGVETEEQVNLLKILGCHCIQGFFFSKPLPIGSFEELVIEVNQDDINCEIHSAENYGELPSNILRLDIEKKNMLIFDAEEKEFQQFQGVFGRKYVLSKATTLQEAKDCIYEQKSNIAILIFCVGENITIKQISEINNLCKQYDVPMITIHTSLELVNDAVSIGVFNCMLKPYVLENMENTVENVICRMKVLQLQKEVKFSDAIVEMKNRAEVDFLSGLLNCSELKIGIQDFYDQKRDFFGIFILIDIDHFKSINIAYGYGVGNKVLHAVGKMIEAIFSESNFVSRIDGDLFAVFIPFRIEDQLLEEKLERVSHAMVYDNLDQSLTITCAVGVCISPENATSFEELYNNADIALSNAKENHKSRFLFYRKGMEAPLNEKIQQQALLLLDDVSDGIFVCDAFTNEIIYINEAACKITNKIRDGCLGARCHQLFWDKYNNRDFCFEVNNPSKIFYDAYRYLKDGKTMVHMKVRIGEWNGEKVNIYYLLSTQNTE